MTTVTTTIPDDTAGKVKRNAEIAFKSISSYIVILASALAAVWLGLTDAQQAAFVAAHPVLTPLAPYLAVIAWLAAKLAPQNIVLSADKDHLRQEAIDWLNELMAKAAPGEAVVVPPAVAKTLGIPAPATPPGYTSPAEMATMVGKAQASEAALVGAQLVAVTQPLDLMAAVRQLAPTLTEDQIRAALAPKPAASATPAIVGAP